MVEVMKTMVTSFKRSHACTAALSAPDPSAEHFRPLPLPETLQRLRQNCVECLLWRYGSAVACHRGRGFGCSRPWYGISPLLKRSPLTPPESSQNLHRTGKQTLGGHKQNLVHTRTQEKGAVTPQETDLDLSMSVQESLAEVWVSGGLLQVWGH